MLWYFIACFADASIVFPDIVVVWLVPWVRKHLHLGSQTPGGVFSSARFWIPQACTLPVLRGSGKSHGAWIDSHKLVYAWRLF